MCISHSGIKMSLLSSLLWLLMAPCLFTTGTSESPTERNSSIQADSNSTELLVNNTDPPTTLATGWSSIQSSMAPLPGITRNRRSTPEHIQYITGGFGEYYDYDDDNSEEKTITTPPQAPLGPCPYDRCKHLEPECDEIQRKAGGNCLCPGLTGPNVLPDSPRLGQVVAGDRVASVSWCSPMSTVQGYIVMYGTPEGPLERGPILNATYRFYSIEGLLPNTPYKLCVVAFNDAGESTVTTAEEDESGGWERGIPRPCGVIRTSGSQWSHIYLGVGVSLAILTGIVGLAVLGYLLWRRKGVMRMKEDGGEEMGVQNQSYKADSVEQL